MAESILAQLPEKIQSRISAPDENGCMRWTGLIVENGYGRLWFNSKQNYAHRLIYELVTGTILPPKTLACHHCDNRWCVNPNHIFLGTHKDNHQDAVSKRRHVHGEKQGNSKLTIDQVKEIMSYPSPINGKELSKKYGVSPQSIFRIRSGEQWSKALEAAWGLK